MKKQHRDDIARMVDQLEGILGELTEIKADIEDGIPVAAETMEARRGAWRETISVFEAALESLGDAIDLLEPLGGAELSGGDGDD